MSASRANDQAPASMFATPFEEVWTEFRYTAPFAACVKLAGEFTDWEAHAIPLSLGPGGTWKVGVLLLPGWYKYRFLVDGQWESCMECRLSVPNPFGTQDAVVEVPLKSEERRPS